MPLLQGVAGESVTGASALISQDRDVVHQVWVLRPTRRKRVADLEREFALSGWEQNPDITNRDYKLLLKSRLGRGPHGRSRRSWTAVPISWSPAIFATGGRYEPPYQ